MGASTAEIKGYKLDERQVASVIDLLIGCDCLFFVTATEMSVNDPAVMTHYQREQAEELTRPLTKNAHPELTKQMTELRARFEAMPIQLFLQAVLLTDLLKNVIDVATQHFALTTPREAGSFSWVVDAKDTTRTPFENAWSMIAGGLIQGRYLDADGPVVATGDFSHFRRFFHLGTEMAGLPAAAPKPKSDRREDVSQLVQNPPRVVHVRRLKCDGRPPAR